jgi:hypothetical protein
MKIIITENKLGRFISKWLSKNYSEMEIYDHDTQPWNFYLDKNGEIIFIYHYKDNELYVEKDIMKFLINMFSIDDVRIKSIFKDWFQEHNDLKTEKVIPWDFKGVGSWKKVVRWETKKRLSN